MFPAKNRLSLSHNGWPKDKTARVFNDYFVLIFKKNVPRFKAAVVISKKVAPKAVERNRIKRMVTESLKKINQKIETVVIVKQNLANLKTQDVAQNLNQLIKKI